MLDARQLLLHANRCICRWITAERWLRESSIRRAIHHKGVAVRSMSSKSSLPPILMEPVFRFADVRSAPRSSSSRERCSPVTEVDRPKSLLGGRFGARKTSPTFRRFSGVTITLATTALSVRTEASHPAWRPPSGLLPLVLGPRHMGPRDRYSGWNQVERERGIHLVARQSRFSSCHPRERSSPVEQLGGHEPYPSDPQPR